MLCGHDAVTAHFTHMNSKSNEIVFKTQQIGRWQKNVFELIPKMIYTFNWHGEVSNIMCVGETTKFNTIPEHSRAFQSTGKVRKLGNLRLPKLRKMNEKTKNEEKPSLVDVTGIITWVSVSRAWICRIQDANLFVEVFLAVYGLTSAECHKNQSLWIFVLK